MFAQVMRLSSVPSYVESILVGSYVWGHLLKQIEAVRRALEDPAGSLSWVNQASLLLRVAARSFSSGQDADFYVVSVIAVLPSATYHIANDVRKRLQLWLKRVPAAGGRRLWEAS